MKARIIYGIIGVCSFLLGISINRQFINLDNIIPNFHEWGYLFFAVPMGYGIVAAFTSVKRPYIAVGFLFLGVVINIVWSIHLYSNVVLAQRFIMTFAGACLIPLIETILKNGKQTSVGR